MDAATARRYAVFPVLGIVLGIGLGALMVAGRGAGPAPADPSIIVGAPGGLDAAGAALWMDVPRPTGAAPATCSSTDPSPLTAGQSLLERGRALRDIGLFADLANADDGAFLDALIGRFGATWGSADHFDPGDPLADLMVASLDPDRVWWRDLEADVDASNQVYAQTIGAWAAISEGAFAPTGITERWDGPRGPIHVGFTLDGVARELRPEYLYDWIDPRLIVPINALLDGSGRQLETIRGFDQTAVVLALTPGEKAALATGRDWCFAWP